MTDRSANNTPNSLFSAPDRALLAAGQHGDPFAVLGCHAFSEGFALRVFAPPARSVVVVSEALEKIPLSPLGDGAFCAFLEAHPGRYSLLVDQKPTDDPYQFGLAIPALDAIRLRGGRHFRAHDVLGAQSVLLEGEIGVRYAVWAPNAANVSLIGGFNTWDFRALPMRRRIEMGVWEIFLPKADLLLPYGFAVRAPNEQTPKARPDPYQRRRGRSAATGLPPPALPIAPSGDQLASIHWAQLDADPEARFAALSRLYPERRGALLIEDAIANVASSLGPLTMERFAPGPAFADEEETRHVFNRLAQDKWAPQVRLNIFADQNASNLINYDGTSLYECADPFWAKTSSFEAFAFDHARYETANWLLSALTFWLVDIGAAGIVLDGVGASLDPRRGRSGLGADARSVNAAGVDFLRKLTDWAHVVRPGALVLANDGADWPGLSRPTRWGGLGFDGRIDGGRIFGKERDLSLRDK